MSEYLNIASALHTENLTLFVGTGFSKYLTNQDAPSWLELLFFATEEIDDDGLLLDDLFNFNKDDTLKEAKYELTIVAQILETQYRKKKLNLKEKICEIIRSKINDTTIDKEKLEFFQDFFSNYKNINIVTTNYDTLFSDYILKDKSRVIIEGSIIPRLNNKFNIYHIHGSINKPESLVLTMNDYYNFQNSNNYFSKKFYTILQETSIVILGYSLADFNLNTILNEVKNTKKLSFRKSDIFYVSRKSVDNIISNFYESTYGINVIINADIQRFFERVEKQYPKAKKLIDGADILKKAIDKKYEYTDDYLELSISLPSILLLASELGIENDDEAFIELLLEILDSKVELTHVDGAWIQYEHLAAWLIEVFSIINLKNTKKKKEFLKIVEYSIKKSSKEWYYGYSWHAWSVWRGRWHEMILDNQLIIEDFIKEKKTWDRVNEAHTLYS